MLKYLTLVTVLSQHGWSKDLKHKVEFYDCSMQGQVIGFNETPKGISYRIDLVCKTSGLTVDVMEEDLEVRMW